MGARGVARADLDGANAEQFVAAQANGVEALAVDRSHIYWTGSFGGTIGRANLDGTAVDEDFITLEAPAEGLAVDARHIY